MTSNTNARSRVQNAGLPFAVDSLVLVDERGLPEALSDGDRRLCLAFRQRYERIAGLAPRKSGAFLAYDGSAVPW